MQINEKVGLFIDLAKTQSLISRKFDNALGGISFNEFIILFRLAQAQDRKMRRIDLADAVGLTASGITRLLLPMEKIGLVKRQANVRDARISYVMLAAGGKQKLEEGVDRAQLISNHTLPDINPKQIETISAILETIAKNLK